MDHEAAGRCLFKAALHNLYTSACGGPIDKSYFINGKAPSAVHSFLLTPILCVLAVTDQIKLLGGVDEDEVHCFELELEKVAMTVCARRVRKGL